MGTTAAVGGGATATTLAGTTLATTTAGVTTYTAAGAMLNAAFTTLVTQASTALMANGGNLGAALRTLGSSASVKSLAASIATAGLENVQLAGGPSLNGMSGLSNLGQTDTSLASSSSVTASAMEGIAGRAVASAGVDSLLQGTSFGQGLIDSTVSDASALGAFPIGDARVSGAFGSGVGGELGYVGSHALLGCAAGAATGAGCGGQAIGAAVSAATANDIADLVTGGQGVSSSGQLAAITGATTLLGAGAAAALGQNPNAAVTGASNETLNNTCADGHNCGETPAGKTLPEIVPGQEANPADPVSEEKALAQEGEVAAFSAAGAGIASAGAPATASRGGAATNTLSINSAVGAQAEADAASGFTSQGLAVQQRVSLTNGSVRSVADVAVSGAPNATVQVPAGFVAEDLSGNVITDASGNPITSFSLNGSGQAIVEIKAGGATLTSNQSTVYPSVQSGTVTSVGGNAAKAFQVPQPSALPATPVIVLRKQ
jgi:filamentous hemagglutinin